MLQTFSERVVKIALSIPKGKVTTYGTIARAAGAGPMAARSISSILGKAHQNGVKNIPWHRIVYSGGKVWLDTRHKKSRLALYKKEEIKLDKNNRIINFRDIFIEFK